MIVFYKVDAYLNIPKTIIQYIHIQSNVHVLGLVQNAIDFRLHFDKTAAIM